MIVFSIKLLLIRNHLSEEPSDQEAKENRIIRFAIIIGNTFECQS